MESHDAPPFSGAPILHLIETTSTMDEARRLAAAGTPRGSVVVADSQSSGRGRGPGRSWAGAAGTSLLCTVVLDAADAALPGFPLRVGLALLYAVESLVPASKDRLRIKWPNDLVLPAASESSGASRLAGASKLAGILCEGAQGRAFVGIGLNLARQTWPSECKLPPISLEEAFGFAPDRDAMLMALLRELQAIFPEPTALAKDMALRKDIALAAVEARLFGLGQRLHFSPGLPGSQAIRGRLEGLDSAGSLRLRLDDGTAAVYASGEIIRD